MRIGLIIQKYFCNNLGVYALSHCIIDLCISYCKSYCPDAEIYIFTDEHERVREEIQAVFNFRNISTFPIIEVRRINTYFLYSKKIRDCDIVLDTGLGDGFSDIYSNGKFLLQFFLKRIPEIHKCKMVLLPQTIGPYNNSLFRLLAKRVIKKAEVCFARDVLSFDYVGNLGCKKNRILTTDMAMNLHFEKRECNMPKGLNVGLNISGLLYMGGYTRSNQFNLLYDYKIMIDKLVQSLLIKGYNIHLISHVYRNNGEGDEFASKIIKEKYGEIILAPQFDSPMEAKAYISNLDFFIGSRMHSTIAAISSGVPVCPIGYSRKFNGLFETIEYKNYVDATSESLDESVEKVMKLIENREKVARDVEYSMKIAMKYEKDFEKKLECLLSSSAC